jgi:hypothetical protein
MNHRREPWSVFGRALVLRYHGGSNVRNLIGAKSRECRVHDTGMRTIMPKKFVLKQKVAGRFRFDQIRL